jgi:hypothetical protein
MILWLLEEDESEILKDFKNFYFILIILFIISDQ